MKAYIRNITYSLPHNVEANPIGRLSKKTGIYKRHVCSKNEVASDLAVSAVKQLFNKNINPDEIEFLLLCTQSPDYILPTTACILQDKLGIPTTCGALDYNLGCSGYIYGLSMAKGLIESGQVKNVLLVTAENYSKHINSKDNSVKPLFGDAATATFIEGMDTGINGIEGFVFGTDGNGYNDLIIPVGGMRHPYATTPIKWDEDSYGNIRSNRDLYMNGSNIGNFAMEVVPDTVDKILKMVKMNREDIDYYIFHQANKFILDYLQEKCKLKDFPFWNNMEEYGNTVSNSIPIALYDVLHSTDKLLKYVMLVGFGVGLSWGGCIVNCQYYKEKHN